MKRKLNYWIQAAAFLLILVLFIGSLTDNFSKSPITGKIYRPQNVVEEIWNLVVSESRGRRTVLTTATEDARVKYDFGSFCCVGIPECDLSLSWKYFDETELVFFFSIRQSDGKRNYAKFTYNFSTKTLYGEEDFPFLVEHFLNDYFDWCATEDSGSFRKENMGEFTFQYIDSMSSRG